MVRARILILDDEPETVDLLKKFLERDRGIEIDSATDSLSAITSSLSELLLDPDKYQLILVDYSMPEMNGREFIMHMRNNGYRGPVLLMTGSPENHEVIHLSRKGNVQVLAKPIKLKSLKNTIDSLLTGPVSRYAS
jgi:DNA-binding response OmpR family regulator